MLWKLKMKRKFETFNDGTVTIFKLKDVSRPGYKPDFQPVRHASFRFEYKTIGIKRNFEAAQAQVRLDELIKIPLNRCISSQDVAVIGDIQYEIKQIQHIAKTLPPTSVLSLTRLEAVYDSL